MGMSLGSGQASAMTRLGWRRGAVALGSLDHWLGCPRVIFVWGWIHNFRGNGENVRR